MRLILALALLAPQEPPPKDLAAKCDTMIEWLTDGATLRDNDNGRRAQQLETLAVFEKAKAQAKAQGRLILWYIPKVWGTHMYRGALPDGYMRIGIWTHPDVVALVKRKFVPMRVTADRAMGEATGIKRFDVIEPAVVLLTPEGRVVHTVERIRTFNPDWLVDVLVSVLRNNEKYNPVAKDARNEDLILGGDYDKVQFKESDPYTEAILARRRRKGDEALRLLEKMTGAAERTEKGRVLLALGRIAEAKKALEEAMAVRSRNPREDEAYYLLSLCHWYLGDEKGAEGKWRELTKHHPDSPWAWRAAANLVPDQDTLRKGPAAHGFEDPFWPPDPACGAANGTRWARPPADRDDAARRGVEFLLRMQRSHGGWDDSRYCYWPDQKILPNVWVCVSAAAAAALLDWRDVAFDRIDAALARAEKYFLDDARLARGINEESYAEAFKILYLLKKQEVQPDPKNLERIAAIAKSLARLQDARGFWSHEYFNPFCTAAVAHAVHLAQKAGAKIDETLVKKAADALWSTRGANGEQSYDADRRPSSMKDSAARVVQCEYLLHVAGRLKVSDVATAFDNFWKHQDRLHAVRVCDFHSDGELAGFFLYHGLYFTSEAVCALPEADRKAHYGKLAEWVLSMAEMDGSFLDSHELGKSYGTAMALRVLRTARGN